MSGAPPQPNGYDRPNSPRETTEKSVKSCYAVVYSLENRKWVVAGEGGWSEVHLCQDNMDDTYRILAWTVKSQEVLMNCNVLGDCIYKTKSKNFHSFQDENGDRFGLGFHKSDSGLKQASEYLIAVTQVIQLCKEEEQRRVMHGNYVSNQSVDLPSMSVNQNTGQPPPNPYQVSSTVSPPINQQEQNRSPPQQQQSQSHDEYNNGGGGGGGGGGLPKFSYDDSNSGAVEEEEDDGESQPQPQQNAYRQQSKPFADSNANANPPSYMGRQNDQQSQQNAYNNSNNNEFALRAVDQNQNNSYYNGSGNGNNINNNNNSNNNGSDPMSPLSAALNNLSSMDRNKSVVQSQPTYHLASKQTIRLPTQPIGTLGNLKILPPKPQKLQSGDQNIKNPNKVEKIMQVTYNAETGQYSGLPKEWMAALNKQFGVRPKFLPGVQLPQYTEKIPKILIHLRESLKNNHAYEQVGIFRLAPNASKNLRMKERFNTGHMDEINNEEKVDINVAANLIKVWFRDLPAPLLSCVAPIDIEMVADMNDAVNVMNQIPEPNQSIFLWLCDMCVEIAQHQKINKMSTNNLAIVIGPNLFNTDDFQNPMKAMTYSQKVVEFFKHCISWRVSMLAQQ